MNGYLYILETVRNGRHYLGSSNDPERRLQQHNAGFVHSTRGKGPWQMEAVIRFTSLTAARRAEYHIKRQKSRLVVAAVLNGTYSWPAEIMADLVPAELPR